MNSDWLIGHLIGDFVLQTDWIAEWKKRPGWGGVAVCVLHASLVTGCVAVCAGWTNPVALALAWLQHFLPDRGALVSRWMNVAGHWAPPRERPVWALILYDQLWHVIWLWAIARWIVR